jgi:hypothetical protein
VGESRPRRGHGEDSIYFDRANNCWVGAVSLGHKAGKRVRRKVTGRTKTEVMTKLRHLRNELDRTPSPALPSFSRLSGRLPPRYRSVKYSPVVVDGLRPTTSRTACRQREVAEAGVGLLDGADVGVGGVVAELGRHGQHGHVNGHFRVTL